MPESLPGVARILLSLGTVYLLLAIGAQFLSRRLIFPIPPRGYALTPDYLRLTAPDGVELAARHWPNPGAKFTILYLHGNYEDLGKVGEYIPGFLAAGFAVFALDYRGYGGSGGKSTEANCYSDARLAYDHLRAQIRVPAERIILFGYSLGAGPAIELALGQPAAGLALQGAFVSAFRVMTRIPVFPGDKFVNIRKVPRLQLPVLVIHGTGDRTVPIWHGEALFRAITAPKSKFFVETGPHTGLADFTGARYWDELKKFAEPL